MRLDRLITLHLGRPLLRLRPSRLLSVLRPLSSERRLPILMYHSISDEPEPGVHPYYRVCTSPRRFAEQMQWLTDRGWQGVTLSQGLAWLKASEDGRSKIEDRRSDLRSSNSDLLTPISHLPSPIADLRSSTRHPVALTFDDGFQDFYTHAFPVLQRHGFAATMYLPTGFITDHGPQTTDHGLKTRDQGPGTKHHEPRTAPSAFVGRDFLSWDQVRELHHKGIEFGSHTVSHPRLVDLSWESIALELRTSHLELQSRLGSPVTAFAYPYAFPQANDAFVGRLRELLRETGYVTNVTTQVGRVRVADDPFQLKRLPVNDADDRALFLAKLDGAYDWLGHCQALAKRCQRRLGAAMNQATGSHRSKHARLFDERSTEPAGDLSHVVLAGLNGEL